MNKKELPSISIVIPTKNSCSILPVCFRGISKQKYPKEKIETIIVDNDSNDCTKEISKEFGALVKNVKGKPPLVCQQRNLGAAESKGEFLLFLDHDMEMSDNLLINFAHDLRTSTVRHDAWYIPEKIITGSAFLTTVRNFERQFYNGTPVDAVRIINKKSFLKTKDHYDISLSNGPADWDLDIQLLANGCSFGNLSEPIFHHEERFNFKSYILKKSDWFGGFAKYRQKWTNNYQGRFFYLLNKQLGLRYRLFTVFFENSKWKKTILNPHLYLAVLYVKLCMVLLKINKTFLR